MLKNKYYAVKKGKKQGIYNNWNECKNQVNGFSGAEYKTFDTFEDAENYINEVNDLKETDNILNNEVLEAYVDGSYNEETKEFSYGIVILYDGEEQCFSQKVLNTDLAEMRNVAGELKGAEVAMRYAMSKKHKSLVIYHDYEGIAKWCTGEWRAKKNGTKAYQAYYNSIKNDIDIKFVKVQGHSNNKYNDMADQLAKDAIFKSNKEVKVETFDDKEIKDNVYINRDLEELNNMLLNEGTKIWGNFSGKGIETVGQHKRFTFLVDEKESKLDIYQRADGSTTFYPTGSNVENSIKLKNAIEKQGIRNTSDNKNYSIFLGEGWMEKTIEFLRQLPNVQMTEKNIDDKHVYQFISKIGDKLTLSVYKDYKVGIQGKPLYLYNEFLSFISLIPSITDNDVVDMTNTFVDTTICVNDVRAKINKLLPKAYNSGKIDNEIWKLFSPSIVLIEDEKILEDYTCCIFPALRALEGYLLFLLNCKKITVDKKHNFGSVFVTDNSGIKYVLIKKQREKINEASYEQVLEEIYNYFVRSRHVYFHANQILIDTKMIENKKEAISIFYEIVNLLESTFLVIENLI